MKIAERQRVLAAAAALLALLVAIGPASAQAPEPGANERCPVMTDEPVKADKFVDFEGKRVYFCCDRCKAKFLANPKEYLANLPQFGGTPHPAGTLTAPAPAPTAQPPPEPSRQWADFLGRLHPVIVHFPIGLLLTAALLELLAIVTRAVSIRHAARACLSLIHI